MCLKLNDTPTKPLIDGNIRYKVMLRLGGKPCRFQSYHYLKIWTLGRRHRCGTTCSVAKLRKYKSHDEGLHVLVHKKDAEYVAVLLKRAYQGGDVVVVELQMKDHIASGSWYRDAHHLPSETWRYGTILKVCA